MTFFYRCRDFLNKIYSIVPLVYRLVLGYAFFLAGITKFNNMEQTMQFFESIGLSAPYFQVYFIASFEIVCGGLIFIGLLTRIAAIPLMVIMLAALETVFCEEIFASCMSGFEIPFYFFLLLAALLFRGPGVVSLDALFFRQKKG